MTPGGVVFSAGHAGGAADPRVLTIGDADDHLVSGHPADLVGGALKFGNVLEDLGTDDAVEALVGEVEARHVAPDGSHPGELEFGLPEIEGRDLAKEVAQDP
jgi:hypothetical protein